MNDLNAEIMDRIIELESLDDLEEDEEDELEELYYKLNHLQSDTGAYYGG